MRLSIPFIVFERQISGFRFMADWSDQSNHSNKINNNTDCCLGPVELRQLIRNPIPIKFQFLIYLRWNDQFQSVHENRFLLLIT